MRLVHGFGVNDLQNMSKTREYQLWVDMIKRSKSDVFKRKRQTYANIDCSNDWLLFSNFLSDISTMKGFRKTDWHLDKDILIKGNNIYSKETCCFVPVEINNIFLRNKSLKKDIPTGVYLDKKSGKFRACVSVGKKQIKYGMFTDPILAFAEYKRIKEDHIANIANKFKDELCEKVFNVLIKHKVSIGD